MQNYDCKDFKRLDVKYLTKLDGQCNTVRRLSFDGEKLYESQTLRNYVKDLIAHDLYSNIHDLNIEHNPVADTMNKILEFSVEKEILPETAGISVVRGYAVIFKTRFCVDDVIAIWDAKANL